MDLRPEKIITATDIRMNIKAMGLLNKKNGSLPVAEYAWRAVSSKLRPRMNAMTKGNGEIASTRIMYPKIPKPSANQIASSRVS